MFLSMSGHPSTTLKYGPKCDGPGAGSAAADIRCRQEGTGLLPHRSGRATAHARPRRRSAAGHLARHRPRRPRRCARLEPRPQRPCRRALAVAEARQPAGLRNRHRGGRFAKRHRRAAASHRRQGRRARHWRRDRAQWPCAGRHLAPFRGRRRRFLLRRLRHGIDALCLRCADNDGGDRAARLLLRRLPNTTPGMLERACAVPRARPAPASGAGQRPRSGDRARTHAPRRRRYFCRCGHAQCTAAALRRRRRFAARRRRRRHRTPRRCRQTHRRRARRQCLRHPPTARRARRRGCCRSSSLAPR